jgi:hypothetical protein
MNTRSTNSFPQLEQRKHTFCRVSSGKDTVFDTTVSTSRCIYGAVSSAQCCDVYFLRCTALKERPRIKKCKMFMEQQTTVLQWLHWQAFSWLSASSFCPKLHQTLDGAHFNHPTQFLRNPTGGWGPLWMFIFLSLGAPFFWHGSFYTHLCMHTFSRRKLMAGGRHRR